MNKLTKPQNSAAKRAVSGPNSSAKCNAQIQQGSLKEQKLFKNSINATVKAFKYHNTRKVLLNKLTSLKISTQNALRKLKGLANLKIAIVKNVSSYTVVSCRSLTCVHGMSITCLSHVSKSTSHVQMTILCTSLPADTCPYK